MRTGGGAITSVHDRVPVVADDVDAPAPGGARSDGWAYRPHLDGLRAIAVYLVVAFHAGIGRLSGGFVGVDVFFVLSGYLVTGVLLRDVDGPSGRVRFGRFYARRVRRLLPAAAVNLVVTALVFRSVADPADYEAGWRGIRSAALYVSNWFFIRESADYFGSDITQNPVAHYWSLSVEEQFYLVWPVLFAGLGLLARRFGPQGTRVRWLVVGAAASASLIAALAMTSDADPNRAYYGTDTRAYQLLAGALLALSPGVLARLRRSGLGAVLHAGTAVSMLGLLFIATNRISPGPIERGVLATIATLAILIGLEGSTGGPVRWALSRPRLVYLGAISYGTYLWHWLVVIVLLHTWELSHVGTALVTATVATGIAALSYETLEQPIRRATALERIRPVVIGIGLVLSLVVGLVVAPKVLEEPSTASVAGVSGVRSGAPNKSDWQAIREDRYSYENCPPSAEHACELTTGAGATVLVIGESHAAMWLPMLEVVAEEQDWHLYGGLLDFCPWPYGIRYAMAGPNCLADQEHLYGTILDEVDPDIVILGHRPIDDPQNSVPIADSAGGLSESQRGRALDEAVRRSVETLADGDRQIVLLEPTPAAPKGQDPVDCLSRASFLEECRFVVSRAALPEEELYRRLASDPTVHSIDLDPAVCPYRPICDPFVDGVAVKWDDTHVTMAFAVSLADEFTANLELRKILPGG